MQQRMPRRSDHGLDMDRAGNHMGQWRPFSWAVGHRLRPPSRALWTDPDYPSGLNPHGEFTPLPLPPLKRKKGSLQWTEIPRQCAPKLWKLSSQWAQRRKRDPQILPLPCRHTWGSKGAQPHPRNPAQYPGISCSPPFRASSLPPAKANSERSSLAVTIVQVPAHRGNNQI